MASINLRGTHSFFISVLDGDSRSIVFRDLRMFMTTADFEIVIQRALEALPKGMTKPRPITSKGKITSNSDWRGGKPPWSKPDRTVAKKNSGSVRLSGQPDRCKPEKCHFR
ncbi:hypothetical protein [Leptospirillum ferriphilum]|uniref:Uncharacterized protein n=1 Tax=Leptospirillum ferriphilum (strain ML-04) TaxID=1048260 RepID=J9ZCP2_LEPFM|nr:hypothetical protein [Leptospirillum ferriphilum]AFS54380.1 hypothetical protein LFML04_2188 [Leptospirillum ferriphilum ML-04]